MIETMKTKKTYFVALAVLFVFISLSETTYSLFLQSDTTDEFNYNTGLLDLKFIEEEPITLENAFPMYDSDGSKMEPYTLTIKNTGSLIYFFNLKMISTDTNNVIDSKYIKVKVNDNLPHSLYNTDNVLESNIIIYPNEEITFKIRVWLDIDTPNDELGKTFTAKVTTSGSGIYKTLDASGANHPKTNNDMIPVYYDETSNNWKVADKSNTINEYNWYNYDARKWANTITVKNSDRQIYDITGNNNIKIDNLKINNGNVVIDENYLDLNINNNSYRSISNIIRVKINDLSDNVYIISNGNISYYYNSINKTFIFRNGNTTITSNPYDIEANKWYILGYTYDGYNVSLYVNGDKISTNNISGSVSSSGTFKLGTDNSTNEISKITVGDTLFYNRILTDNEISNNYKTSLNVIYDGLVSGYREFTPMTLKEYYLSSSNGTTINDEDIDAEYVWIPRFKYRVWNVLGEDNVDTYDAYHKGIDVVFENMKASSGTIYCEGIDCYSDTLKTMKVTSSDNGKYYTHPAFSNTTEELTGLWVSKYEVSDNMQSKKGNNVLTNNNLSSYYSQIKNISNESDYHVIKNTEWGAITYLSHSKYGLCQSNTCADIGNNNSLISGNDSSDTTTGNIYGVFDLSGSANEYTMGNISDNNSLNLNNSFFKDIPLGTDDYDLYQNNTFILGDATKELSLGNTNWYNSTVNFDTNNNWIVRNNLYGYLTFNDIQDDNITTRIVIK